MQSWCLLHILSFDDLAEVLVLRRVILGFAASHARTAGCSQGAALPLEKKRSSAKLVKYLAKH